MSANQMECIAFMRCTAAHKSAVLLLHQEILKE